MSGAHPGQLSRSTISYQSHLKLKQHLTGVQARGSWPILVHAAVKWKRIFQFNRSKQRRGKTLPGSHRWGRIPSGLSQSAGYTPTLSHPTPPLKDCVNRVPLLLHPDSTGLETDLQQPAPPPLSFACGEKI